METMDLAGRVIDELKTGVRALLAVDPHASCVGGDHERMVDLVGLASMFEAVVSRFAGPWDAGMEWASDRVDVLARANTPGRANAFAEREDERVRDATRLRHFNDFARATRYWCDAADAASDDGDPERRARRQRDGRRLDAALTLDGTTASLGVLNQSTVSFSATNWPA